MSQPQTDSPKSLRGLFRKLRTSESPKTPRSSSPSYSLSSSRVNSTSSLSSLASITNKNYGKKISPLGSGIAARVDLYYQKSTANLYAIKTYHPQESYESKSEYKTRCMKEYNTMRDLIHPNILQVYDFLPGFSSHQLVMEYAPYSLLKLIQIVKPSDEEILCFFRQVCEGVQFLHSLHISHRDLKMENIVVDETATVKLIDFGTAFEFGPEGKLASGIVGTEALVSPEALSSLRYDSVMNDIWALGVLLYSMVNLSFPWKVARESDLEYRAFKVDKNLLKGSVPDEMWPMLNSMLEFDSTERVEMTELLKTVSGLVCEHDRCEQKLHQRTIRACSKKKQQMVPP